RMPGPAGFVSSCDFAAPSALNTSGNLGEYFYAFAPTQPGGIDVSGSPARWLWTMRSTVIHEVKHITSVGERVTRGAPLETAWLEESTARIAEELLERARWGFRQHGNVGYGSSGDPAGPWCAVRPTVPECHGRSRGIYRVFEGLAE